MVDATATWSLHTVLPWIGRSHRYPPLNHHLELPALGTPIKYLKSLSNTDLSKCFVEVDIVEMSMTGKEQRHTMAVVPLQCSKVWSWISPNSYTFPSLTAPTLSNSKHPWICVYKTENEGVNQRFWEWWGRITETREKWRKWEIWPRFLKPTEYRVQSMEI